MSHSQAEERPDADPSLWPRQLFTVGHQDNRGFPAGGSHGKESACGAGDLGREGPLETGMATQTSIPAWRISWTEEPGGL